VNRSLRAVVRADGRGDGGNAGIVVVN